MIGRMSASVGFTARRIWSVKTDSHGLGSQGPLLRMNSTVHTEDLRVIHRPNECAYGLGIKFDVLGACFTIHFSLSRVLHTSDHCS